MTTEAHELVAGTSVKILGTENVQLRYPEFVGCIATIDKVPVHPSTWFTVKINHNKQTLKLQPTALKILSPAESNKSGVEKKSQSISSDNVDMKNAHAPSVVHKPAPGRPRTNSFDNAEKRARSNSMDISHAHTLTLGAEVVIRATENVLQVIIIIFQKKISFNSRSIYSDHSTHYPLWRNKKII